MPFVYTTRGRRWDAGVKAVSYSALRDWLECPRMTYYNAVRRLKPGRDVPSFGYIEIGTVMHNLIRDFFRKDGTPKYKSAESFAGAFRGRWYMHLRNQREPPEKAVWGMDPKAAKSGRWIKWKSEDEMWVWESLGEKMCRRFYERRVKEQAPYAVELSFAIEVPLGPYSIYLSGRSDEINAGDGWIVNRDYKTRPQSVSRAVFKPREVGGYIKEAHRSLHRQGLLPELNTQIEDAVGAIAESVVELGESRMHEDAAFLSQQLTSYAIGGACILAENAVESIKGCKKGDRFIGIFDKRVAERIPEVRLQLYDVYSGTISETRKTEEDARNLFMQILEMKDGIRRNSYPYDVSEGTCPRCFYRDVCEKERSSMQIPQQSELQLSDAGEMPRVRIIKRAKEHAPKQLRLFKKAEMEVPVGA